MAERLTTMKRGRAQQHDWAQWTDGSVWRLTRGVDFTSGTESMRVQLYGKARQLGKKVVMGELTDTTITFQMVDKDVEEA